MVPQASRNRVGAALIARHWAWPVALAALVTALVFVVNVPKVATVQSEAAHDVEPPQNTYFGTKRVVYEVTSPGPDHGTVVYLNNKVEQIKEQVSFPWTTTFEMAGQQLPVGVTAQAHGGALVCRVLVDGLERAKDAATMANPAVNCNVMAI